MFISYRHEDTRDHVHGLRLVVASTLRSDFGDDLVFVDTVSIRGGGEWPAEIRDALDASAVVLVLIGPRWHLARNEWGQRRLDEDGDWVCLEVATALAKSKKVIPVLFDGGEVPPLQALPESLQSLVRKQTVKVRHDSWDADVLSLAEEIKAALNALGVSRRGPEGAWSGIEAAFATRDAVSVSRVTTLLSALAAASLAYEDVEQYAVASAPNPARLTNVPPSNLRGLLYLLDDMMPRYAGAPGPLLEFAVRMSWATRSKALEELVADWISEDANLAPAVARLRDELRAQPAARPGVVHLYVDVACGPPRVPAGEEHLEYWVYVAGLCEERNSVECNLTGDVSAGVMREAVRRALSAVVGRAEAFIKRRAPGSALVAHLYASIEQLGWDFDDWRRGDAPNEDDLPIFAGHSVVVGWVERVESRDDDVVDAWEQVWGRIHGDPLARATPSVHWLRHGGAAPQVVRMRVRHDNYGACVGFAFVPAFDRLDSQAGRLALAALKGGVPVAVWAREEPADWARVQQDLDRLVQGAALDELPHRFARFRLEQHLADPATRISGLTLLWDVPDRKRNPLTERLPGLR